MHKVGWNNWNSVDFVRERGRETDAASSEAHLLFIPLTMRGGGGQLLACLPVEFPEVRFRNNE